MNIHALEILNRFGDVMLQNMLAEFPDGFQIVATDSSLVTVGNKLMNAAFSRKTLRLKHKAVFEGAPKLNRKLNM
jgi:hypothetical protein